MIILCYYLFFGILFLLLESLCRTIGFYPPVFAPFLFYASVVFGWKSALTASLIAGIAIDLLFGAGFPWSVFAYGASVALGTFWLYHVESDSIMLHLVPGFLIPAFVFFPEFIKGGFHFGMIPLFLAAAFAGAFFLPLLILVLDGINVKLGIDLYSDAKLKQKHTL